MGSGGALWRGKVMNLSHRIPHHYDQSERGKAQALILLQVQEFGVSCGITEGVRQAHYQLLQDEDGQSLGTLSNVKRFPLLYLSMQLKWRTRESDFLDECCCSPKKNDNGYAKTQWIIPTLNGLFTFLLKCYIYIPSFLLCRRWRVPKAPRTIWKVPQQMWSSFLSNMVDIGQRRGRINRRHRCRLCGVKVHALEHCSWKPEIVLPVGSPYVHSVLERVLVIVYDYGHCAGHHQHRGAFIFIVENAAHRRCRADDRSVSTQMAFIRIEPETRVRIAWRNSFKK